MAQKPITSRQASLIQLNKFYNHNKNAINQLLNNCKLNLKEKERNTNVTILAAWFPETQIVSTQQNQANDAQNLWNF